MKLATKEDLENLIIYQVEENLNLDYKSSDSLGKSDGKKKEISKDVSAFANSDGGIIIYGIKEFDEKNLRHLPEKIDSVNRIEFSKEWLEQIINSNISPRIENIRITPISLSENLNEVAYIVQIPKSNTSHQASDFRYYRRYNFESIAMYDYEVKDIMNRNKTPKFQMILEIEKYIYEEKPNYSQISFPHNPNIAKEKKYSSTSKINVFGKNIGSVFANYVNCYIEVPTIIIDEKEYNHKESYLKNGIEYKRIYCDNTIREVKEIKNMGFYNSFDYWPARYEPILPELKQKFETIKLKKDYTFENEIIYWEVYADNAEKRMGEILISELNIIEKKETK